MTDDPADPLDIRIPGDERVARGLRFRSAKG